MLECKLDEATVELGVTCIRGLTCPVEIMYPDSQPEFPIIERTYFVQFMFPMTQIADNMTEMESVSYVPSQAKMEECMLYKLPSIASQRTEGLESIELEENLDEACADSVPDAHANVQTPDKKDNKVEETDMMPLTKLVPINTQLYQWEQEMQLDWSMSLSQTDLLFLRDSSKKEWMFILWNK
uniref:Uncharacterized protein n=1 Tax=Arion vulgaris TaxID=1028688 RepID=A0A0B7A5F7_9EUPU